MSSSIVSPFPFFTDTTGAPLEGGYIFIGQSNLNPETAPVNVFWDSALTIPAAQPVRTVGGYPSRAGTPSRFYSATDTYSITVRNKNRVLVFSAFDQSDAPTSVFDISTQLITATASQTTFSLTTFTYLPGTDTLQVFRNGLRLNLNLDYLESNSSTVTLTAPAALGDQFLFQGGTVVTGNQTPGTAVSFIQAGAGAVTRNMQDKARESVSVLDFGAVGDGVTNDTVAFQAVLSLTELNKGITCNVPKGTYLLSGTFSQGLGFVVWNFAQGATLTGAGATTLPFIPKKIQLDGTPVVPTVPYVSLIQGTNSNPRTDLDKKKPAIYIERHTNSNPPDSSDWGNPRNSSPVEIENIVYGNETGSQHTIIGRVFSAFAKAVGSAYQSLVSASFLAQSNAPAGSDNRDCWGANIVVASSSGNAPTNLVGIEVDVIGSQAVPLLRPGLPGAFNATAYWAQAASNTSNSNTGLYVSSVDSTYGWLYGAVFDAPFYDYIAYLKTSLNAPSSKGVRIETQWQSNTGRVLECYAGPSEQFRIDGESTNPIWILVGGALKKIEVGAVDSGGTGYRALRVLN